MKNIFKDLDVKKVLSVAAKVAVPAITGVLAFKNAMGEQARDEKLETLWTEHESKAKNEEV